MSWYSSDEEEEERQRYSRFCPKLQTTEKINIKESSDRGPVQFIPIPIPMLEDETEFNTDDEEEIHRRKHAKGKLDKWDRSARSWLSSGTVFFLLILFHLIQIRSDIRKFTSAANDQLHQACNVLENKTVSLSSALNLATQDVGPISLKFVRDLKGMIRKAFHFAGQIFGGRIREVMIGLIKKYYCLFIGAVVVFQSLSSFIIKSVLIFRRTNDTDMDYGAAREQLEFEERERAAAAAQKRTEASQRRAEANQRRYEAARNGEEYEEEPLEDDSRATPSEEQQDPDSLTPSDTDTFIDWILLEIQSVINNICDFLLEPERFFSELFTNILDKAATGLVEAVVIPNVAVKQFTDICVNVRRIDFDEIEALLKRYMVILVAIVSVLLVLYSSIQFLIEFDSSEWEEEGLEENQRKLRMNLKMTRREIDEEIEALDRSNDPAVLEIAKILPFRCARNAARWMLRFFSYRPFWVFLSMGVFGVAHLHFSNSLHRKAQYIMNVVIFPAITELKDKFTDGLSSYLQAIEMEWTNKFLDFLQPLKDFISELSVLFSGIIEKVVLVSNKILEFVGKAVEIIQWFGTETLKKVIVTILDCLLLKNFKIWKKIIDLVRNKLFNKDSLSNFNGGVVGLLKRSIDSIFANLNVTAYLKKQFSVHFLMFLNLICKRSIFLYVYLILAFILFCQGTLMMVIKFLLGYF